MGQPKNNSAHAVSEVKRSDVLRNVESLRGKDPILAAMIRSGQEAYKEVLKVRQEGLRIEDVVNKGAGNHKDLVSKADKASQGVIEDTMKAEVPEGTDIDFYGEDGGDLKRKGKAEHNIIADSIDGTTMYIFDDVNFAVSIADMGPDGKIHKVCMVDGADGSMIAWSHCEGVILLNAEGEETEPRRQFPRTVNPLVSVHNNKQYGDELLEITRILGRGELPDGQRLPMEFATRNAGSLVRDCMNLIRGRIRGIFNGECYIHDIAGIIGIAEAIGAEVHTLDGREITTIDPAKLREKMSVMVSFTEDTPMFKAVAQAAGIAQS